MYGALLMLICLEQSELILLELMLYYWGVTGRTTSIWLIFWMLKLRCLVRCIKVKVRFWCQCNKRRILQCRSTCRWNAEDWNWRQCALATTITVRCIYLKYKRGGGKCSRYVRFLLDIRNKMWVNVYKECS
jgi:hypothetical protein